MYAVCVFPNPPLATGYWPIRLISPRREIKKRVMRVGMNRQEAERRTRSIMKKKGRAAKTKLINAAVDMYEYATRPATSDRELERAARIMCFLHYAAEITFDDVERMYRNQTHVHFQRPRVR